MTVLTVGLACAAIGLNQSSAARQDYRENNQPATADQDPGDRVPSAPEILNRGPMHEAYANPTTYDPAPGPRVVRQAA